MYNNLVNHHGGGRLTPLNRCKWDHHLGPHVQVQVQVCFTSVGGQVQPLDVALRPQRFVKVMGNSSANWNISHLEHSVVSLISGGNILANGANDWWYSGWGYPNYYCTSATLLLLSTM
jgi:hypothetical protein